MELILGRFKIGFYMVRIIPEIEASFRGSGYLEGLRTGVGKGLESGRIFVTLGAICQTLFFIPDGYKCK